MNALGVAGKREFMHSTAINIWALPKEGPIRVALLRLSDAYGLEKLLLDWPAAADARAVWICHRSTPELNAYLYTHGQARGRYGLQLGYPAEAGGAMPPYPPLEAIGLGSLIEHLCIHFELT